MHCIRPIKAGFDRFGNIVYSSKKHHPELPPFQFDCRKCLPCRLNQAREKAVRCYHEAKMHEENIFLTLTYDNEHLESPRLIYPHFQTFMKDLRYQISLTSDKKISCMVTGEYGDKNKRPHWHALIFNYRPADSKHKYTSDRGDQVFNSQTLGDIWGRGASEFGSLTLDSANYVARYAAKKLNHGNDQDHDFHPIHKTSSKNAIGRSWIEKYWKNTFELGYINLPNGSKTNIPRYYVDWLKKHHFEEWCYYVTYTRQKIADQAEKRARLEEMEYFANYMNQMSFRFPVPLTRSRVELTILEQKFKKLQEKLKL